MEVTSLARRRGSGKTDGATHPKCLRATLVGKGLAALQRSNASLQEARVSFFRDALRFHKEVNKTARLRRGIIFKVPVLMQF